MKQECDAIKKEHSEKKELLEITIMLVEMQTSIKGVY